MSSPSATALDSFISAPYQMIAAELSNLVVLTTMLAFGDILCLSF